MIKARNCVEKHMASLLLLLIKNIVTVPYCRSYDILNLHIRSIMYFHINILIIVSEIFAK